MSRIHPLSFIERDTLSPVIGEIVETLHLRDTDIDELKNNFERNEGFNSVCFGIKTNSDGIRELEIYFYRYNTLRRSHLLIELVPACQYHTKVILNDVSPLITSSPLIDQPFSIVSYNVTRQKVSFYFTGVDSRVAFFTRSSVGDIENTYGFLYHKYNVFKDSIIEIAFMFQTNCELMFYGEKTESSAIYLQEISFESYIAFLIFFKYEKDAITRSKQIFNSNYTFDVSFDFKDSNILRTSIYGVF